MSNKQFKDISSNYKTGILNRGVNYNQLSTPFVGEARGVLNGPNAMAKRRTRK